MNTADEGGFTDRNRLPFLREAALVAMESMCRNATSTFLEFPSWVLVIHTVTNLVKCHQHRSSEGKGIIWADTQINSVALTAAQTVPVVYIGNCWLHLSCLCSALQGVWAGVGHVLDEVHRSMHPTRPRGLLALRRLQSGALAVILFGWRDALVQIPSPIHRLLESTVNS